MADPAPRLREATPLSGANRKRGTGGRESDRTLRTAAEAFLDTIGPANTRRSYGIAIVKTVDQLDGRAPDELVGPSRTLDSVTDAEIVAALESLWGAAAAGRSTPPDSDTPARSRTAIDRIIGRREIHVREKALWPMLYETCVRAEGLLQLKIEDLDLAARSDG